MICQPSSLAQVALFVNALIGIAVLSLSEIALYWRLFDKVLELFKIKRLLIDAVWQELRKHD
jgi:hypothetical protein